MSLRRSFFTFLEGKRLRASFREQSYVVRVFHPRGQYPRTTILQPNAIYWADDELVFSVVHSIPWRAFDETAAYTEMDWLAPDELQFLGSILFCETRDDAPIKLYPVYGFAPRIARKTLDLTRPAVAQKIRDSIWLRLKHPTWGYHRPEISECLTLRYTLVAAERFNLERQPLYWSGISPKNYVLLRGISALLKSDMLSSYYEFYEEATIAAFIAMEASFRLILRQIQVEGVKQPTAQDAARWLFEHFDKPMGLPEPTIERYFEEFYDQRVMTLHPSSRFGDNPYAPVSHDDYYHLRSSLREVLAYVAAGSHGPDFYADVKQARGPFNAAHDKTVA